MNRHLDRSLIYLLAVVLLAVPVACRDASPRAGSSDRSEAIGGVVADRVLVKAEFRIVVAGVRYALVQADSMYVNEDSTSARIFGLHLLMPDTVGNRIAEVRSPVARYNLRTQKLLAEGSAVLTGPASGRLETDALNLDPAAHRIWSDVSTKVQWSGGGTTTFATFTVDDRFANPKGTSPRGPERGRL